MSHKKKNGNKPLTWSSHRGFTDPLHEGHGDSVGEGTLSGTWRALGTAAASSLMLLQKKNQKVQNLVALCSPQAVLHSSGEVMGRKQWLDEHL